MATDTSLRARKKVKTRDALCRAAVELFISKGFEATTVEEICERAEVSPSTFFRYFPTKEAAAFADEEMRIALVESIFAGRGEGEPWHAVVRRAALELVDWDVTKKWDIAGRGELMSR